MKNIRKEFKGNWELVEWVAELVNGKTVHPFGPDIVGKLTYDKKGNMAVQLMRKGRKPFRGDDPFQASPEEMLVAFQTFLSYCGTYEVDEEAKKVNHHITISSIPNWTDQVQVRNYEFVEDKLILSTDFIGPSRHKLTWRKI